MLLASRRAHLDCSHARTRVDLHAASVALPLARSLVKTAPHTPTNIHAQRSSRRATALPVCRHCAAICSLELAAAAVVCVSRDISDSCGALQRIQSERSATVCRWIVNTRARVYGARTDRQTVQALDSTSIGSPTPERRPTPPRRSHPKVEYVDPADPASTNRTYCESATRLIEAMPLLRMLSQSYVYATIKVETMQQPNIAERQRP